MSEPRTLLERYRLDRQVSATATASVFRGTDLQSGEAVAVKLIASDGGESAEQRDRFLQTAGALRSLRHPSVPRVLDFGFTPEGSAFLVTELLAGASFADFVGAAPAGVLSLLLGLVDGLEALAGVGISIPNLSAENLMVTSSADGERISILGLGSAVLEPGVVPTLDGYPEERHAFGLLACRLLRLPMEPRVGMPLEVAAALRDAEALRALLDAALRGDPRRLYPSWEEVRRALRRALEDETGEEAAAAAEQAKFETHPGIDRQAANDAGTVIMNAPPMPWAPARFSPPSPASAGVTVKASEAGNEVGEDTIARPPEVRIVAPAPPPPRSRRRPWLWLGLALAAAGLAAVAFALVVFLRFLRPSPPPPPQPRPAVPLRVPAAAVVAVSPAVPAPPPVHPQIVLAEAALVAGDLKGMKAAIDAITPAEQAAFRPEERDRYQRLIDALTPLKREELAGALGRALESGDLRALRAAVRAVPPGEEGALQPAVQKDLAQARRAVAIDAQLARAQKEGNLPEIIRQADALLAELPHAARAGERKELAAATLETAADAAAEAGQLDAAAGQLDSLRQVWPDRTGLAGRIERVAAERKADQDLESVLAAAGRAEKAGKPLEAVQLLASAKPNRRYADRFQEVRQRLDAEVAQLDRRPPELSLRGAEPVYEKGKTVTIPLRITDDLAVKSAEGWARPEGGQFVKVAIRHLSGADYAMDVPPELHQNRTVEYYAVATDPSGHAGQLGSADHPLKLKRKSWIDKILRKDGTP
jgi:hypothetical protein